MTGGWIGVDLDGTLAIDESNDPDNGIGDPVPAMLARVKKWVAEKQEVRILTARVSSALPFTERVKQAAMISEWSLKHIGTELEATCEKDFQMWQLWDDRAVQVVKNTGERVGNVER